MVAKSVSIVGTLSREMSIITARTGRSGQSRTVPTGSSPSCTSGELRQRLRARRTTRARSAASIITVPSASIVIGVALGRELGGPELHTRLGRGNGALPELDVAGDGKQVHASSLRWTKNTRPTVAPIRA